MCLRYTAMLCVKVCVHKHNRLKLGNSNFYCGLVTCVCVSVCVLYVGGYCVCPLLCVLGVCP